MINIDNSRCELNVQHLKIAFVQQLIMKSQYNTSFIYENILTSSCHKINTIKGSIENFEEEISLSFPEDSNFKLHPSIQSDYIICNYFITLSIEFDSYLNYYSPSVSIPVIICNEKMNCKEENKESKESRRNSLALQENLTNYGTEESVLGNGKFSGESLSELMEAN